MPQNANVSDSQNVRIIQAGGDVHYQEAEKPQQEQREERDIKKLEFNTGKKKNKRKNQGSAVPQDIRDKLSVEAMHRCCICPQHESITDLHHIKPISKGGSNKEDNLMVVCPNCHADIHRRRMYTPTQLKMYKEKWISRCAKGIPLEMLLPSLHYQTKYEPNFVGRTEMLETITKWYKDFDVRIGALIGWGGVGKSALVRKWYDSLKDNNIQPDGIFWWGFYHHASLELFLNALLRYVSQEQINPETIKSTWQKVEKIKEFIVKREYLIILDGLEEMQKGVSGDTFGSLSHPEFFELLKYIADAMPKGMCLIATRYPIKDLEDWRERSYRELSIVDLELKDAKALLRKRNIWGEENDFEEVIQRYKAHALALTSLAGYLNKYCHGDICQSPNVPFVFEEKERWKDVNKLFRRYTEKMSEAELAFLKLFSLFRTEVREMDFAGVFRKSIEGTRLNNSLIKMDDRDFIDLVSGLVEWRLLSHSEEDNTYATHPLIKGYFESTFEEEDKKLCHKQLYHYFGEIAPEKPETLDQMQPLFEQVYHGCQAGIHQEVFYDVYYQKVQREEERFLVKKLGDWEANLSLIQNFFTDCDFQKEALVTKIGAKGYLINEAGLSMTALGRLKDAEGLYKKGVELAISQKNWGDASVGYRNLASLQILTGNLLEAKENSERAIRLSRDAKSVRDERDSTAYLAYTLFLLGDMDKAGIEFKKAETLQRKFDPSKRYLYTLDGIFYAEFLLAQGRIQEALDVTNENLRICERNSWIDDINLCHRSLAAIYRHLKDFKEAVSNAGIALEGAKKTGRQDIETASLIELARIRLEQGQYPEAESTINQALRLCQRCGYKLYEADAELLLAKTYLAQNDTAQAKSFAQSAYDKASSMNYHLPKTEAKQVLEKIQQFSF